MLPVPPGCRLDESESKPDDTDPQSDGTSGARDGWALFSGTSAAAPQLKPERRPCCWEVNPRAEAPAQIIEVFSKTAIDITMRHLPPQV